MPPDLVVATAAVTNYPGGVVAVKANQFMGSARGTLTSGSDTLACSGTRVRDTQQVTANMRTAEATAFAEAEDTLVIPLSSLALDSSLEYVIFVSYRIPGEWDVTNADTLIGSTNAQFVNPGPAGLGFYGSTDYPTEADFVSFSRYLNRIPHYVTGDFNDRLFEHDSGETLHFRAYSQDGTTIEWLLDQLIFMPFESSAIGFEFGKVGGQHNISFTPAITDGADGGDDNGKFTWAPRDEYSVGLEEMVANTNLGFTNAGGGDYQRKSSASAAEYYSRVSGTSGPLLSSPTDQNVEGSAWAYSLHGVRYRQMQEWMNDTFSRTVTGGWGESPEGYEWEFNGGVNQLASTDGSIALHSIINAAGGTVSTGIGPFVTGTPSGATLQLWEHANMSGRVRVASSSGSGLELRIGFPNTGGTDIELRIQPNADTWNLRFTGSVATVLGSGTISWHDIGDWIGWRLEVRRHRLRMKIWDDSGAEPGTWDFDGFKPVFSGGSNVVYPYSDDPLVAVLVYRMFGIRFRTTASAGANAQVQWDDIVVAYDPDGDPEDMTAEIERPEGTIIGEQIVPYGAAYFVYWGLRDWTDLVSGNYHGVFSTKVWNDPAAAELQRAEQVFHWFRALGVFLVSMNWRSGDRQTNIHRIHVGTP